MEYKVKNIIEILIEFAPLELAMENDNCGLILGDMQSEVTGILTCLDVTNEVVQEAIANGANLIISHHPLIFYPQKSFDNSAYESSIFLECARNNINVVAMHTNLDACDGGINDYLAHELGLENIQGKGFFRKGNLPQGESFCEFEKRAQKVFADKKARVILPKNNVIKRVAVASGSGGRDDEMIEELKNDKVDVLITGEVKHSIALKLAFYGIGLIEIGHYYTEICSKKIIAKLLAEKLEHSDYIYRCFISESQKEKSPFEK
ncbi:MAG: Nif3-like dinuclear metal center hexameric protein [Clostridia bacterium]